MAINFHAPNALRALKRLVKLQALVRGYLMRKRAAVRDQTAVKIQRARCSFNKEKRLEPEFRHQKSLVRKICTGFSIIIRLYMFKLFDTIEVLLLLFRKIW